MAPEAMERLVALRDLALSQLQRRDALQLLVESETAIAGQLRRIGMQRHAEAFEEVIDANASVVDSCQVWLAIVGSEVAALSEQLDAEGDFEDLASFLGMHEHDRRLAWMSGHHSLCELVLRENEQDRRAPLYAALAARAAAEASQPRQRPQLRVVGGTAVTPSPQLMPE